MNRFDYIETIKEDLRQNGYEDIIKDEDINTAYDMAFIDDSITGNASGSYTCNAYKSRENIEGAEDIIEELIEDLQDADIICLESEDEENEF